MDYPCLSSYTFSMCLSIFSKKLVFRWRSTHHEAKSISSPGTLTSHELIHAPEQAHKEEKADHACQDYSLHRAGFALVMLAAFTPVRNAFSARRVSLDQLRKKGVT